MSESIGRLLAAGNVAEVFEWGSRVVKLYRSAAAKQAVFREAGNHAAAEALELPVPLVWGVQQINGRWGIVFDRVNGGVLRRADARRSNRSAAVPRDTRPAASAHSRASGPRIQEFEAAAGNQRRASEASRRAAKAVLARPPRGFAGRRPSVSRRFHPINVLGDAARPVVIDWPDACRGDPAADVCRSYLLLKLHAEDIAEPYLDAYCRIANVLQGKILDWLPHVAAARLAEVAPDDLDRLLEIAHS